VPICLSFRTVYYKAILKPKLTKERIKSIVKERENPTAKYSMFPCNRRIKKRERTTSFNDTTAIFI